MFGQTYIKGRLGELVHAGDRLAQVKIRSHSGQALTAGVYSPVCSTEEATRRIATPSCRKRPPSPPRTLPM